MADFRTFRNYDPPGIAEVWNEALIGRGAVRLRHASPLEHYVFGKTYFDPRGFIVATEDKKIIGFSHASFGPSDDLTTLNYAQGIVCMIAVRPSHQRKGIGAELLRLTENYVRTKGATRIQAGQHVPMTPFYLGLYGGSSLPGVLKSDASADPFFLKQGYTPCTQTLVQHRKLKTGISIADGRFPALRKRFEVKIRPRQGIVDRWTESTMGPIELVEFRLEEKSTSQLAAIASVWEMDGFGWRWNQPSVGIHEIHVSPDFRRQACAKFLVGHLLKYLQEQYFEIVEAHVEAPNSAGISLLKLLGFEQVDEGICYSK